MPKIIDYPRASLPSAIDLAVAVDELGGSCTIDMAAEKLGKKVSGAFRALMSSSAKYGLIETKSQKLNVTSLFREYKLSYSEDERKLKLRESILLVPLFKDIYNRFSGKEVPVSHFERLLIREFGVPDDLGSRVASYFLEGAKLSGLMGENSKLIESNSLVTETNAAIADTEKGRLSGDIPEADAQKMTLNSDVDDQQASAQKKYTIRITGPGMNSLIELNEQEDMLIVQAMLKKVEKALKKE